MLYEVITVVSNTSGCAPLTVNLVNPYGAINSSVWTLQDGTTLTGDNVNMLFNNSGSYTITLSSTNEFGCASTQTYTDLIDVVASYNFV